MNADHSDNTISDEDWHEIQRRALDANPDQLTVGTPEFMRRARLGALQYAAAREGRN